MVVCSHGHEGVRLLVPTKIGGVTRAIVALVAGKRLLARMDLKVLAEISHVRAAIVALVAGKRLIA